MPDATITITIPGFCTVTFPASVVPEATPAPQPPPKLLIGTNVGGNDPWNTDAPFADVTRRMTGWYQGSTDPPVVYGPGGYPQTPAFAHCWLYGFPAGTYRLHWVGGGNLSVVGKQIANVVTTGSVSEGTVTFASGELCKFRAIGPVSDVHLYTPDAVAGQTYRPAYLNLLKGYTVIRTMAWARPNGEMPVDSTGKPAWPLQWSQRNLPTNWDQTTKEVALELQLELAKESGCIPWLNTYYVQSDDSLNQMAQLVKTYNFPLVAVESQNEYWNQTGRYQGNLIRADAAAMGTYGSGDINQLGARRAASIGANVGKIFRSVLGKDKVKVVFGGQATWGAWAADGLSYVPAGSFDALAIAPYFQPTSALPTTATMADVEAALSTWISGVLDGGLAQNATAAKNAGVELWSYEGGQHVFPVTPGMPSVPLQDTPAKQAAFEADIMTKLQSDPAIGRLYDQLFAVCRKYGMARFTHFLIAGYWGSGGYWGGYRIIGDPDNEKTKALARAIAAGN